MALLLCEELCPKTFTWVQTYPERLFSASLILLRRDESTVRLDRRFLSITVGCICGLAFWVACCFLWPRFFRKDNVLMPSTSLTALNFGPKYLLNLFEKKKKLQFNLLKLNFAPEPKFAYHVNLDPPFLLLWSEIRKNSKRLRRRQRGFYCLLFWEIRSRQYLTVRLESRE